ncbi:MAG: HU family DNA-binding protein [Sideroxydans sp.]|nr:HU family DNA-binding protein [Sideroxydans sp.]
MSDDNKIALHAFAALVAKRAKVSNVEADTFIHQFAKTMSEELETGGDILLYHFGRFHTTHVDEQAGHGVAYAAPFLCATFRWRVSAIGSSGPCACPLSLDGKCIPVPALFILGQSFEHFSKVRA